MASALNDSAGSDWTSVQTEAVYVLRLYVTGATPRSARAISNATRLCNAYLSGRYTLDIIDIFACPLSASEDQIVAAPTLVRLAPAPTRKIIGDLSDEAKTLSALGLAPNAVDAGTWR